MKDIFKFQKFDINQKGATLKVGTDGVLLGAWANLKDAENVLDVGSGTGLISIMLAQRFENIQIDAIEIDKTSSEICLENFKNCPWTNRLNIFCEDFLKSKNLKNYEHIVSNPPFFKNSLIPQDNKKSTAKHNICLSIEELAVKCTSILNDNGKVSIIFPYSDKDYIIDFFKKYNLFLSRLCQVRNREDLPFKRLLLEFSKQKPISIEHSSLTITDKENIWSENYKNLCKDFYLKLLTL